MDLHVLDMYMYMYMYMDMYIHIYKSGTLFELTSSTRTFLFHLRCRLC